MNSSKKQINIAQPSTGVEEIEALSKPLETGWLTQGPKVKAFENQFAKRHNVPHALATTSCTTALHLALAALDISKGDEVIVPAFTWISTANVVLYCGAKPIFVDVDEKTFNIDFNQIKPLINKHTKAIIPVHLFGLCADIDAINSIIPDHVSIIEDAACAAGAICRGISAGALGDFGCFSFHPRKTITTGEGGMLTTKNLSLYEKASILRSHGASISEEMRHQGSKPYMLPDFNVLGFNYRMTDFQGAIGTVQLSKLDRFISERQHWASWYTEVLSDLLWISLPEVPDGFEHSWQAYVITIDEGKSPLSRNKIIEKLAEQGISTRPGTHAVTDLNYYKNLYKIKTNQFPIATKLEKLSIALPLHNEMTSDDYDYVSQALHRI